jgi:hypothetical protein
VFCFPFFFPFTFSLSSPSGGAFWLAIQGYTYHRVFPTNYENQPVHWLLYDSAVLFNKACDRDLPMHIVELVCNDLHSHNYLYHAYQHFARFQLHQPQAHVELSLADPSHGDEIAALYAVGSAPAPSSRTLYVQHASLDNEPRALCIPILHALYEPLQYLLLFPQGTRGLGD